MFGSKSKLKSTSTSKRAASKSSSSVIKQGSSIVKQSSTASKSMSQVSAPPLPKVSVPASKRGKHVVPAPAQAQTEITGAGKTPVATSTSAGASHGCSGIKNSSLASKPNLATTARDAPQVYHQAPKPIAPAPVSPFPNDLSRHTKVPASKSSASGGKLKSSATLSSPAGRTEAPGSTSHHPVVCYPAVKAEAPKSKASAPMAYYPQQKPPRVTEHRSANKPEEPVVYLPAFKPSLAALEPYCPETGRSTTYADSDRRGWRMPSFKPRIPKNPAPKPLPKPAVAGPSSTAARSSSAAASAPALELWRTGPWECHDCGEVHEASREGNDERVTHCRECCEARADGDDLAWQCCQCKRPNFGNMNSCPSRSPKCQHARCHNCRLSEHVPMLAPGEDKINKLIFKGPFHCRRCGREHNRAKHKRYCRMCWPKDQERCEEKDICDILPWVCCRCEEVYPGSTKKCRHHSTPHNKCDKCWLTISMIKVPKGPQAPFPFDEQAELASRFGRLAHLDAGGQFPEFEDLAEQARRHGEAP